MSLFHSLPFSYGEEEWALCCYIPKDCFYEDELMLDDRCCFLLRAESPAGVYLLFDDTGGGVALWRKIACTLVAAGTLALSVVCFCNRNGDGAFVFREAAFVFLFLFALLTGECFYIWLGGDVRHKTNLAFCAAFFIVLFVRCGMSQQSIFVAHPL